MMDVNAVANNHGVAQHHAPRRWESMCREKSHQPGSFRTPTVLRGVSSTVVAGGFGGSSTRLLAKLLSGCDGVVASPADDETADSLLMRSSGLDCAQLLVSTLHRCNRHRLFLNARTQLPPFGPQCSHPQSATLRLLKSMQHFIDGANVTRHRPVLLLKEPRAMFWLPQLQSLGLATHYIQIVRDVRSIHRPHIEIDPRLWVAYYGGAVGLTRAVTTALQRLCTASETREGHESSCAYGWLVARGGRRGNDTSCRWLTEQASRAVATQAARSSNFSDFSQSWLAFMVGWTDIHTRALAAAQQGGVHAPITSHAPTKSLASPRLPSQLPNRWFYLLRVERLWAAQTCSKEMSRLLEHFGLSRAVSAPARCGNTSVAWPPRVPRPETIVGTVPMCVIHAIAGKTLAALGYASAPKATAPADVTPAAKSSSACPARRGAWSSSTPPAGCVLVVQLPRASDGMLRDGMPIRYPHVLRDWLPLLWRCADCNAECSRVYVPPDDGSSAHTESIYRPLISAFAPRLSITQTRLDSNIVQCSPEGAISATDWRGFRKRETPTGFACNGSDVVFYTRPSGDRRRTVLNPSEAFAAVRAAAAPYNLTTRWVTFETQPMSMQRLLMCNAQLLVGQHGGGIGNILFSHAPHRAVIELPPWSRTWWQAILEANRVTHLFSGDGHTTTTSNARVAQRAGDRWHDRAQSIATEEEEERRIVGGVPYGELRVDPPSLKQTVERALSGLALRRLNGTK